MSVSGAVTYGCPHCRKPFSIIPIGQAQLVSCPSCGGRVTVGPTQPPVSPQQMAPGTYPIQQQSIPSQQPYQPYYPQPMYQAPTPPPKKSKKGVVVAVMVVVIILIIGALAYIFVFTGDEDKKGNGTGDDNIPIVTYEDFLDDINVDFGSMAVTFDSYEDGDIIDVVGTVKNLRFANVPSGVIGLESGIWTIIYFESPGVSSLPIFEKFAYPGDLKSDYTIGEEGTVRVHIKEISAMGYTMEYPEESMTADMLNDYLVVPNVSLTFTQTTPGNYTGSITSSSDIVRLEDIEITIYDSSEDATGYSDWDLTDDNPETVETYRGDLVLEFWDENNDDMLDLGDTFKLKYAEPGDEVELLDSIAYDPDSGDQLSITKYTVQ